MFQLLKTTVLASACALAAASALAADAKNYPGSMGVKYSGATPSYSSSAIVNPSSSSWMYVDLPAINDEDNDILISYVRVLDRHYSSDVRCSINQAYWNNSADAMYGWWGTNVTSTGSSSNSQTLSTGPLGGTGMTVHTYFSCAVPPSYSGNQSRIISYYVYEG